SARTNGLAKSKQISSSLQQSLVRMGSLTTFIRSSGAFSTGATSNWCGWRWTSASWEAGAFGSLGGATSAPVPVAPDEPIPRGVVDDGLGLGDSLVALEFLDGDARALGRFASPGNVAVAVAEVVEARPHAIRRLLGLEHADPERHSVLDERLD